MTKEQAMVAEFHRQFDFPVRIAPMIPDTATQELRLSLIREELKELESAFRASDIVKVADGLGDLLYVVYGCGLTCGLLLSPVPSQKKDSERPNVPAQAVCDVAIQSLMFASEKIADGFVKERIGQVESAIILTVATIYEVAALCCIPIETVFAEIHRSNMTKVGGVKRADGKLIKPSTYEPPNLAPILGLQKD